MYTAVCHTDRSRRAWCGFYRDRLLQSDKKKTHDIASCNYDANQRSTGPLQGAREIMHIIFLLCCAHKKNTGKKKSATYSSVSVLLHEIMNCRSFSCDGNLKPTPPRPCSTYTVLYSGKLLSSETWPGPACVLLTPDSRVDPTQPAGHGERERER